MEIIDDTPEEEPAANDHQAELDGAKIQQLSTLRRGAIRVRSWCLIAATVCLVAAVDLVFKSVQYVRQEHRWGLWPTSFVLFACAALMVALHFFKRAAEMRREIDKPPAPDPAQPPDFSTLSDGSQQWKNLEDVR